MSAARSSGAGHLFGGFGSGKSDESSKPDGITEKASTVTTMAATGTTLGTRFTSTPFAPVLVRRGRPLAGPHSLRRRAECVAAARVADVHAALEPLHSLGRRTVREPIGCDT